MSRYGQFLTREVVGYSGARGFSGTHSVLDWETLRRGALGGRDDSLAYKELEERQDSVAQATGQDDVLIYIEPEGSRCYDTRVFASDDGAEEKKSEEENHRAKKEEEKRSEDKVIMMKEEFPAESKKEEISVAETSRGNVEILEEIMSVSRESPTPVEAKKKRGRPRSTLAPLTKQTEKKRYTPDELKLPSEDWKAYIVLHDPAQGKSMVYTSPEGIPCYSVEMMYALEGIRNGKIDVEKNLNVLLRNTRALQLYPLFKSLRPDTMGNDALLLQRIGHARKKKLGHVV